MTDDGRTAKRLEIWYRVPEPQMTIKNEIAAYLGVHVHGVDDIIIDRICEDNFSETGEHQISNCDHCVHMPDNSEVEEIIALLKKAMCDECPNKEDDDCEQTDGEMLKCLKGGL